MNKQRPVRNGYRDRDGYVVERFVCENAPTNRNLHTCKEPALEGHSYARFSWGNSQGYSWGIYIMGRSCRHCGGKLVPIDQWKEKESE